MTNIAKTLKHYAPHIVLGGAIAITLVEAAAVALSRNYYKACVDQGYHIKPPPLQPKGRFFPAVCDHAPKG